MTVKIETERDILLEHYGNSDPVAKCVLLLASVVAQPISYDAIYSATRILEPVKKSSLLTNSAIKRTIKDLLEKDLLHHSSPKLIANDLIMGHIARDAADEGVYQAILDAIRKTARSWEYNTDYSWGYYDARSAGLGLRHAVYTDNVKWAARIMEGLRSRRGLHDDIIFFSYLALGFRKKDLMVLRENAREKVLYSIALNTQIICTDNQAICECLQERVSSGKDPHGVWRYLLAEIHLARGNFQALRTLLAKDTSGVALAVMGVLKILERQFAQGQELLDRGLKAFQKYQNSRVPILPGLCGCFQVANLLHEGSAKSLRTASRLLKSAEKGKNLYNQLLTGMGKIEQLLNASGSYTFRPREYQLRYTYTTISGILGGFLAAFWNNEDITEDLPILKREAGTAQAMGCVFLAAELNELIARISGDGDAHQAAVSLRGGEDSFFFVDTYARRERWELVLGALENLTQTTSSPSQSSTEVHMRLVWVLCSYLHREKAVGELDVGSLEARQQKQNARGTWSKGQKISERRLLEERDKILFATDQDRRVIATSFTTYGYSRYGVSGLDVGKAIAALRGHPYVFWQDDFETPVEIVKREPGLTIEKREGGQMIRVEPLPDNERPITIEHEAPYRLGVYEFSKTQLAAIAVIRDGLLVPRQGREQARAAVEKLASVFRVQADNHESLVGERIAGTTIPRVRISQESQGYRVAVDVTPGPTELSFDPGVGNKIFAVEHEGRRLLVERNLGEEATRATDIYAINDTLMDAWAEGFPTVLEDESDILEFLLALQKRGDEVVVEWPDKGMSIVRERDLADLRINISKQRDWFELDGSLKIDEDLTIQLHKILDLVSPNSARFIKLDDKRFLALTERFRRRIEEIRLLTVKDKKSIRMGAGATLFSDVFTEDFAHTDASKDWIAQVSSVRDAMTVSPEVPSLLEADLREYQREGFTWLCRLAGGGFGACLADDMGLGKTMQALALLLFRASGGPALIVAPTSVTSTWENEARRFAPALKTVRLREGNRTEIVENAGAFDVVLCSYGLLISEEELLCGKYWSTLILDEAQAIKNAAARRSRVAMTLNAGFRIVTTGTPVENHLGELWTIMHFLNPGLLGTQNQFLKRFAGPIERDNDAEARRRLKRMVAPFILRRTKSQVLDELPPKTEINIEVELSEEEAAFYEALRRKALEEIAREKGSAGQKQFRVLAEITRLRRACCHPTLVAPKVKVTSSKLAAFMERLEELQENNHRALVFSQFVDHLTILRTHLESRGIEYQYLDGSTPPAKRDEAIEAFRRGEGLVFLISLKAGGFGLNLTAADYVFIMDPWWNPAVEDQASDRAHRIGQQRPVTVYRFVAKGTIEERIIRLHKEKRDLAEGILEGTDSSSRIHADELLEILRERET